MFGAFGLGCLVSTLKPISTYRILPSNLASFVVSSAALPSAGFSLQAQKKCRKIPGAVTRGATAPLPEPEAL